MTPAPATTGEPAAGAGLDAWIKARADRCSGCGYATIQGRHCEASR